MLVWRLRWFVKRFLLLLYEALSHILFCSYTLLSHGIDHCYVPALDILAYPLLPKHWDECRAFLEPIYKDYCQSMDRTEPNNSNTNSPEPFLKVFVHCEAGINRSGTIVAAAMMEFAGIPLFEAARLLKRQRGIIMTNATFQEQLVEFSESLDKKLVEGEWTK